MSETFIDTAAGQLKKRLRHRILQEYFQETTLDIIIVIIIIIIIIIHTYIYIFFFKQFLSRIPEIIGTFREKFIFQIIGPFLLFMSSF